MIVHREADLCANFAVRGSLCREQRATDRFQFSGEANQRALLSAYDAEFHGGFPLRCQDVRWRMPGWCGVLDDREYRILN